MNRGIERRVILLSAYYKKLPELLGLLVRHYGTRIHSYVLMPNHYHPRESRRADLSEAMQMAKPEPCSVVETEKRGRLDRCAQADQQTFGRD